MSAGTTSQAPQPREDLERRGVSVGTWDIAGDAEGQAPFTWADGGDVLVQHVAMRYGDHMFTSVEMSGHLHRQNEEPSEYIHSRYYSNTDDFTLDIVYEFVDNTLTIWHGDKSARDFYPGTFSADGNTAFGAWGWPSGGYSVTFY